MQYHVFLLAALVCFGTATLSAQTLVNIRVMLEGPLQDGLMSTNLRENLVLPISDPYGIDTTARLTSLPERVVDWIALEFRTSATGPAVHTLPALLRNDGQIMATDGAPLRVAEHLLPHGKYFIVVGHRNHLDIMSAAPVALDNNSELVDFTRSAGMAWSPDGTAAQTNCNGIYAMCMGDLIKDNAIDSADWKAVPREGVLDFLHYSGFDLLLQGTGTITGAVVRVSFRRIEAHSIRRSFVPNAHIYRAREYSASEIRPQINRILPELADMRKVFGTWVGSFNVSFFPDNILTLNIDHVQGNYLSVRWHLEGPTNDMHKSESMRFLQHHAAYNALFSNDVITWRIPFGTTWYNFRAMVSPDGSQMRGDVDIEFTRSSGGMQVPPLPFTAEHTAEVQKQTTSAQKSVAPDTTCDITGRWSGLFDTGNGIVRPLWVEITRGQNDSLVVQWVLDDSTGEGAGVPYSDARRFTTTGTSYGGCNAGWTHKGSIGTYQFSAYCYDSCSRLAIRDEVDTGFDHTRAIGTPHVLYRADTGR